MIALWNLFTKKKKVRVADASRVSCLFFFHPNLVLEFL